MESSEEENNTNIVSLKYGIVPCGTYVHASKHCNIMALTYNTKTKQYTILDSRGITGWFKNSLFNYCTRLLHFDSYKFNLLRDIIYCRSANVYFAVSKDYGIKVYNLSFIEIFCIERDGTTIMKLLFNTKRSELIVISRNNFECWKYTIVEQSRSCEGLKLLRKYSVPDSSVISNVEYDDDLQRLYLLCEYDVWCYDVSGRCIAHFVHSRFLLSYLTVCTFSKQANTLIAGTSMGELSIYDTTGGLFTTLLNHTRTITSLLTHPSDGDLFISSSMDGTIKIFSLQMFEQIYSFNVFPDGIHWMKLRANHVIYCSSQRSVRLFDLNYICSFWSAVRSPVHSINIYRKEGRGRSHIVVHGEDKCIRIYNKGSGRKRCTILPPPESFMMKNVLSFSYDRIGKVIYILFSEVELWIYITRTDPATRVAVWNIQDILKTNICKLTSFEGVDNSTGFGVGSFSQKQEEEKVKCLCTGTVSRDLYAGRLETSSSLNFNLLMCGMSNGNVYFLDPCVPISIILGFKAHPTSPILELKTVCGTHETHLITLIQTVDHLCVKIWNARNFMELDTIIASKDISVYLVKSSIFVSGDCLGNLRSVSLKHRGDRASPVGANIKDDSKEHNGRIVSVDILETKELICSCGEDKYIRLWNFGKYLLTEIKLDESLCYSSFLRGDGSLLIGFKSHLFTIPSDILNLPNTQVTRDTSDILNLPNTQVTRGTSDILNLPNTQVTRDTSDTLNLPNTQVTRDTSDESDTDSLVYEDPHIRQEFRRHVELKTVSLENYLIPYPCLNLSSKWMYQKPISDKHEGINEEEEQNISRPNSTTHSDMYAATEVYADSLCSNLSNICLDIEMPKCCESPELWNPIENGDRQLGEFSDFNQNKYEYDFVRSRVEFPSTKNLLNPDKVRDEEEDGKEAVVEDGITHTLDQQLVEGPTNVKRKQNVKKQRKKKGKFKSHKSKGNNVPKLQETKSQLTVTPRNVINDNSEVAYTSHMSKKVIRDEGSADEHALKNTIVQLAVNYLSSSKRDLSTSSYRSMLQSSKNEPEAKGKSFREDHGIGGEDENLSNDGKYVYSCDDEHIKEVLTNVEVQPIFKQYKETTNVEVQPIFKQYKETTNVINSLPRVRVADHYPVLNNNFKPQTDPLSLLNDDRNNFKPQTDPLSLLNDDRNNFKPQTDPLSLLNDDRNNFKPQTDPLSLLNDDRNNFKPQTDPLSLLNDDRNNFKPQTDPLSLLNDDRNNFKPQTDPLSLLNDDRNNFKPQTDPLSLLNDDRNNFKPQTDPSSNTTNGTPDVSRDDITLLSAKLRVLLKRYHSNNVDNNDKNTKRVSRVRRIVKTSSQGVSSSLSNGEHTEYGTSLRSARNVETFKHNNSKRNISANNRKHKKIVGVNQTNENIGFDFVLQGNDCPIIPNEFCKSSSRENHCKKVDSNMQDSRDRQTSSLSKLLSTAYKYSPGLCNRATKGKSECNVTKEDTLPNKSFERCFGEERNDEEYIENLVCSDWSTIPPHIYVSVQNNNTSICDNDSPPGYDYAKANIQEHLSNYQCETSRYKSHSSTTDKSLSSNNDKITRINSGWSQPIRRKLSIKSSPQGNSLQAGMYCYEEPTSINMNPSKETSTSEKKKKRKEMLIKLEHKMSGQPYRLHHEKTQEEIANDQVKLKILKSKDLGQQFRPLSKRSVSIPSKCEFRTVIYQSGDRCCQQP